LVAAVGKEVRGAPEETRTRRLHLLCEDIGDRADVLVALLERRAFRRDVGVVEAEERDIEEIEELEGDVGLEPRPFHALAEPWPVEGTATERVAAFPGKGVPVGNGGPYVVLHPLAHHQLVLVVVTIGQRVLRARAFELDGFDPLEEIGHLRASSMAG
jgi:hypothetical protein